MFYNHRVQNSRSDCFIFPNTIKTDETSKLSGDDRKEGGTNNDCRTGFHSGTVLISSMNVNTLGDTVGRDAIHHTREVSIYKHAKT